MGLPRGGVLFVAASIALLTLSSGVAQAAPRATAVPAGSLFTSMTPTRVLDTRDGTGTNGVIARVPAGLLRLDLSTTVPAGATAVVLNLTGVNPTQATFISVQPNGGGSPFDAPVSNLNLGAGEVRANAVTVELGTDRSVLLSNQAGSVDLVADLAGYYTPGTGAGFTPQSPTRVLDTRDGTGIPAGAVGPNTTVTLDLTNHVPAAATAVTLNLTGTDATAGTFVTAWPDGGTRPTASSLNLSAGKVVPNLVTVALGADHKIDLYNFGGTIDLVADLAGYYATGLGDPFFQLTPQRALDTRNAGGHSIGAGQTQTADLSEWLPTTAAAAVVNLTGTDTTAGTFVTAWPADATQPLASNLNLTPGQTAANLATVALGSGARLDIGNFQGTVDVIVDIAGYFAPVPTACAGTCAITWGANFIGQLGNGTTGGQSAVPTQVPGISGLSAIAGAYGDTYALNTDGTVYAWGINELRQLGNGRTDGELPTPAVVTGLPKITAISAGEQNGYAVDVNHNAWAWGDNESGGLGDGNRTASAVPVQVSLPGPVTSVIGTSTTAHALLADGTVWSWGDNQLGVLGNGTIGTGCSTASPVNCDSPTPVQVSGLTNVVALYGSGFDAYAVKSDGTVWAWGWNAGAGLGNGTVGGDACFSVNTGPNCVALTPVPVAALSGVTRITGGYAIKADGTVLAWGDNSSGELGLGTTPTGSCSDPQPAQNCFYPTPVALPGLSNITDVTTGVQFTAALKSDGTVWMWGNNFYGQTTTPTESTVPVQIAGLSSVTEISAGLYHMAALTTGS